MRFLSWLTVLTACLAAQTPTPAGPARLLQDLRAAIHDDSLATAAELAAKLDEAVQQRYNTWLISDGDQRIDEALAWLPADIESVWVNRQPFAIRADQPINMLWERPDESYSLDRLAALNDGQFYRALGNHKIRLVVAGARNIGGTPLDSVPAPVPPEEVAYVFFLVEPIELAAPTQSIQGRPVWHAIAKVNGDDVPRPNEKPAQRDDENWLALARPDVMILTNRHALLAEILERAHSGSKTRALPADLPEWAHVDRSASFWGLRHYTDGSKAKKGEPGFGAADLPHHPDRNAVGATVRFDSGTRQLEIIYLSPAELQRRRGASDPLTRVFQVDQPEAGVWRLASDVNARGPFPVHFALAMLGFGMYR
jgi:hypothetical protein